MDPDKIAINFILSTSRSGSTLLSSLLGTHTHILSAIEEPFAYLLYQKYEKVSTWDDETIENYCSDFYFYKTTNLELQFEGRKALKDILTEHRSILNVLNAIRLTYLVFQPKKPKDRITTIVDKQLQYHYHITKLNRFYPDCKFIVLTRDPRDSAYLNQKFFLSKNKIRDLYILAKSWDFIYSMIYRKLKHVDKSRILHVKYEDMVSNPKAELERICNFLNVDFESDILKFHESASAEFESRLREADEEEKKRLTVAAKSTTQEINTSKIDLWKKELKAPQSDLIWSICRKTAALYHYSANGSKNIFYSDFFFRNYYRAHLLNKVIIKSIYHALPFPLKHWFKKSRLKLQRKL